MQPLAQEFSQIKMLLSKVKEIHLSEIPLLIPLTIYFWECSAPRNISLLQLAAAKEK